jgi:hypothetical protein
MNHHRGKATFAQDAEFSAVLRMLDSFFPSCHPNFTEDMLPFNKSQMFTTSIKHINFYLAFRAPFAFWEVCFHKIKERETVDHTI